MYILYFFDYECKVLEEEFETEKEMNDFIDNHQVEVFDIRTK